MVAAHDSQEQDFSSGCVMALVNMAMLLILSMTLLSMAAMYVSVVARSDARQGEASVSSVMEDMHGQVDRPRHGANGSMPDAESGDHKAGRRERAAQAPAAMIDPMPPGVQDFALQPDSLVVRFRPGALDLNPDEVRRFRAIFVRHFGYRVEAGQVFRLTVDAVEGSEESNRMAFYRVVAVRNHLMGAVGVPAARISQKIQVVPGAAAKGGAALEVRIRRVD